MNEEEKRVAAKQSLEAKYTRVNKLKEDRELRKQNLRAKMEEMQLDPEKQQQAEVLQAVVLADSFAKNFRPITFEMPKMLMPLASLPMIEYTLEFLAAAGVQEVLLFCCSHADQIKRYVRETQLERRLGREDWEARLRERLAPASARVERSDRGLQVTSYESQAAGHRSQATSYKG